jgi:hypothetical protein
MKYVMFEYQGLDTPIIFPDYVSHAEAMRGICPNSRLWISAGFVGKFDENKSSGHSKYFAFGESKSLKLQHRNTDDQLINKLLNTTN